jgi:hypothetical protein
MEKELKTRKFGQECQNFRKKLRIDTFVRNLLLASLVLVICPFPLGFFGSFCSCDSYSAFGFLRSSSFFNTFSLLVFLALQTFLVFQIFLIF